MRAEKQDRSDRFVADEDDFVIEKLVVNGTEVKRQTHQQHPKPEAEKSRR